jgi:hypothetical protein
MRQRSLRPNASWALAGFLLVGFGGCASEEEAEDLSASSAAQLDPSEAEQLERVTSALSSHKKSSVRPIFECVEKKGNRYVAHFGYENTGRKTAKGVSEILCK